MHALTLLVAATEVDALCDRLCDELDALSASIEDADAGTDERGAGLRRARHRLDRRPGSAPASAPFSPTKPRPPRRRPRSRLRAAIRRCASSRSNAVGEEDWVRLTQSQFGPCAITPTFWIVPTWSDVPPEAREVIRLDPGRAFGTGTHPTTRMCLRWIAEHGSVAGTAWPRVLDYGCGSGVLAIAARRFGARHVDAVDIDPAAIEATRANALANGVDDRGRHAAGRRRAVPARRRQHPRRAAQAARAGAVGTGRRDGRLVLSGVLARQADELRSAYAPWLDLDVAAEDDGWILLVGTRSGARRMA